jgi:hypothetical protein
MSDFTLHLLSVESIYLLHTDEECLVVRGVFLPKGVAAPPCSIDSIAVNISVMNESTLDIKTEVFDVFKIVVKMPWQKIKETFFDSGDASAYMTTHFAEEIHMLLWERYPEHKVTLHEVYLRLTNKLGVAPTVLIAMESGASAELAHKSESLPGADLITQCPIPDPWKRCDRRRSLHKIVIHLNDTHKWTRDQIADWLDGLYDQGMTDLAFKESNG